jgi:CHAT domain
MPSDFTVRGIGTTTADDFAELYGRELGYASRGAVSVRGLGRGSSTTIALEGADDDIVEIEDTDGVVTFQRAGTLFREAQPSATRGTPDIQALLAGTARGRGVAVSSVHRYGVQLPAALAEAVATLDALTADEIGTEQVTRDGAGMIAKLLPNLLFKPAAKLAVEKIVAVVDDPAADQDPDRARKPKTRGVYLVDEKIDLTSDRLLASPPDPATEPWLVLLHGTFSHTEGGFGDLKGKGEWERLARRYPGRILALEHATLGRSPVQNACELAERLPDGARLHLISHSRGGLIGDVLSLAATGRTPPLECYDRFDRRPDFPHPDRAAWNDLREILCHRNVKVERFARVACPARGTTLAGSRLDTFASAVFNVFNLVPVLRETGVAALVKKFLTVVLEQRNDPRVVPGIAAMIPQSPLLLTLLNAWPPLDDGLGSITANVEARGVLDRLRVVGARSFYWENNDFIVPTRSMDGGAPRKPDAARKAFLHGPGFTHGAYLSKIEGRLAVEGWLGAGNGKRVDRFPEPLEDLSGGTARGAMATGAALLLVPDLFGSAAPDEVDPHGQEEPRPTGWPDPAAVARRGLEGLRSQPSHALVPDYDPLIARLGQLHEVHPVPFDSAGKRKDVEKLVADRLKALLDGGKRPVHLVGHGAGGLLLLAALADKEIRERWQESGGRAVLLGPPLDGSRLALAREAGKDELTASLALLIGCSAEEVGAVLRDWELLKALEPDPERCRAEVDRTRIDVVHGAAEHTICAGDEKGGFRVGPGGDGFAMRPAPGPSQWFHLCPHARLPGDRDLAGDVLKLLAGDRPGRLLSALPEIPADERTDPEPLGETFGEVLLPTASDLTRAAWAGVAGGPADAPDVLRIEVVHGHLRTERAPMIVGHQEDTPISGAERALDQHLDGALRRRLDLGQYPGPLHTCELFGGPTPVAAVIGLGSAGELTPRALTDGVLQAVLRLAAAHLDAHGVDEPPPLTVASVLIGTAWVPAVPLENALLAVVEGVRRANRRLRDVVRLDRAVVDRLRIVELYEDRAVQAIRAAARMPQTIDPGSGDVVAVERRLQLGCFGLPGSPPPEYQQGGWRTIRIVAARRAAPESASGRLSELSFTSIGRAARAEQVVGVGQRANVEALVRAAVDNPRPDQQLLNTLYELIVPKALKEQFYGSENLMLMLDDEAAALPLEMLATRSRDGEIVPLCVAAGVLRRLETPTFADTVRPATGRAALVIGDPPAGRGLQRLPGARAEAEAVARALTDCGWDVTRIIPGPDEDEADIVTILNALFHREYRIIHIAGHGAYDEDPARSGVLLGPDRVLGSLEIGQMATAPDLVFLNCCHLGTLPRNANVLASSISRRLIDDGVRSVVAAGWAVDDLSAGTFAETFYRSMLGGDDLGRAAHRARRTVHRMSARGNTWGAYQVYGPPELRLARTQVTTDAGDDLLAPRDVGVRLDALYRRASNTTDADAANDVAAELEALFRTAPPAWVGTAERLREGAVWAVLARYEQAVAAYESAQRDATGAMSLRSIEQLANVRAKWAVEQHRQGSPVTDLLAAAAKDLDSLQKFGETPERLALRGSLERRAALCLAGADRQEALRRAAEAYRKAAELHRSILGSVDYYAELNWVVLQATIGEGHLPDLRAAVAKAEAAAAAERCATFWSRVTPGDAALALAVVDGTLDGARIDGVIGRYLAAFEDSSVADRMTVLESLEIIAGTLADGAPDLAAAVGRLRARIEQEINRRHE